MKHDTLNNPKHTYSWHQGDTYADFTSHWSEDNQGTYKDNARRAYKDLYMFLGMIEYYPPKNDDEEGPCWCWFAEAYIEGLFRLINDCDVPSIIRLYRELDQFQIVVKQGVTLLIRMSMEERYLNSFFVPLKRRNGLQEEIQYLLKILYQDIPNHRAKISEITENVINGMSDDDIDEILSQLDHFHSEE